MKNNILDNIITQTLKNRISFWYKLIIFLISALNIAACVIDYGFVLNDKEQNVILNIYNVAWWCYFITFLVRIVFQWKMINRKTISLTTITGLPDFVMTKSGGISLQGKFLGVQQQKSSLEIIKSNRLHDEISALR